MLPRTPITFDIQTQEILRLTCSGICEWHQEEPPHLVAMRSNWYVFLQLSQNFCSKCEGESVTNCFPGNEKLLLLFICTLPSTFSLCALLKYICWRACSTWNLWPCKFLRPCDQFVLKICFWHFELCHLLIEKMHKLTL